MRTIFKDSAISRKTRSIPRTLPTPLIEPLEQRQLMSASISGNVFNDLNVAGGIQRGDPGLVGVRVYVDVPNAGVYQRGDPNALTDIHGNYTIAGLSSGMKSVREILPAGFRQSLPTGGAARKVSLLNGASVVKGVTFGDTQKVRVSGTVYNDTNKNGSRQSTGAHLAGATVFLDTNGNGMLDAGEKSTTTNSNGYFAFDDLPPGKTYIVDVDLVGPNSGAYSSWIKSQPFEAEYRQTLQSGQTFDNLSFGIHAPARVIYNVTQRYIGAAGPDEGAGFQDNNAGQYSRDIYATDMALTTVSKTTMNSNISLAGISATGSLFASNESVDDFAISDIDVTFTVLAATTFHMSYAVKGDGYNFELKNLKAGAADVIPFYQPTVNNPATNYSLATGGTLAPGKYELIFNDHNTIGDPFKTTAYSLNFAI